MKRLFGILFLLAMGMSSSSPSKDTAVWITQPDGAKSCEGEDPAKTLEKVSAQLKGAGIEVLEMKKGNDGKMYLQMCGAPTGSLNAFKIVKADLKKALELGFQLQTAGAKDSQP
jgi:hypothetical protein